MGRISRNSWFLIGLVLFAISVLDHHHVGADVIPSENECRPYIEKAIHELKNVEAVGNEEEKSQEANLDESTSSIEEAPTPDAESADDGIESVEENAGDLADEQKAEGSDENTQENQTEENVESVEKNESDNETGEVQSQENDSKEQNAEVEETADTEKSGENESTENTQESVETPQESTENDAESGEAAEAKEGDGTEDDAAASIENGETSAEDGSNEAKEPEADSGENSAAASEDGNESVEENADNSNEAEKSEEAGNAEEAEKSNESEISDDAEKSDEADKSEEVEASDDANDSTQTEENTDQESTENADNEGGADNESTENATQEDAEDENKSTDEQDNSKDVEGETAESNDDSNEQTAENETNEEESVEEKVRAKRSIPDEAANAQSEEQDATQEEDGEESQEATAASDENAEGASTEDAASNEKAAEGSDEASEQAADESQEESAEAEVESVEQEAEEESEENPEEDLTIEFEIPKNLRSRSHIYDLLGLDAESSIKESALKRTGDVVLKELKKTYDNAIRPLEAMYKYRDLSNRHYGDPEIFSKPLVLFMGPWSGGKSTILNYLTENEYTPNSIRSGAEPSPAYFNILMHGDEPEVLDGTQLAADWTFSGLQKFGQGLMDRLRGQKLNNKLLERVNIVEIPGILEVRKQVSRFFPFNDACQWFIDRADIIFLVYDPSKLDVGPETEAILDQLKGREYQTRIVLNKADQVKPEELLRVQGALIWNISPLMSSAQPPVMYTVSLWSHPFEHGAPIRLLQAQERALLIDLREAIDRRIENKIASARRFAVRIRNHAKMVDCYLTTYYNQKGLFSNKKQVSDKIIEHPQNYNIYEGLSTLTNISRYDLPDPEVYLDFFRLNPLYEFKKLSETCTYFKGCPINKLDIAIAYELPELVGKYKKLLEQNLLQLRKEYDENCNQTEIDPPVKIIKSR